MDEIATTKLTIINELGLHARAATLLVQTASKFESDLYVNKDGRQINGKSIMGVMMLAAPSGSNLTIRAEGEDAQTAVEQLVALVNNRFGEEK